MRAIRVAATFVFLSTVLGASTTRAQAHPAAPADVRAQIDAANKAHIDAYNAGDVAKFAEIYAPNAVLMPPNQPAVVGREAIAQWWQGGAKAGVKNIQITTTELGVHDDMAHETGTYDVSIQATPGGPLVHDHGKFIVIWLRDASGAWHWFRDIYNSDLPPAK